MSAHFDYQTNYPGPAFPVAAATVRGRSTKPVTVTGLIDSGADATILPAELLRRVDARRIDVVWARTVNGQRYQANLFQVSIQIGEYEFPGIEVIANVDTDEAIIGRDVLNQLYVVLDGPGETAVIDLFDPHTGRLP